MTPSPQRPVDRPLWATASDLSRYLGVPVGTIHRWAHEDRWERRRAGGRLVVYALWQAYASHNRRRESCDTPSENPCF